MKNLIFLVLGFLSFSAYGTDRVLHAQAVKNGGGTLNIPSVTPTAHRACIFDLNSTLSSSSVTDTELGYVAGVTSAIQTQLNAKQASGNYITDLSSDVSASGPGTAVATVNSVGGSSAANLHAAEVQVSGVMASPGALISDGLGVLSSVASGTMGSILISNGTTWTSTLMPSARYHTTAGQSIPSGSAIVDFDTVDWDTAGLVTTGAAWKFTSDRTAYARVSAMIVFGANATGFRALTLKKNGSNFSQLSFTHGFSADQASNQGSDSVPMVNGDYLQIQATQNSGSPISLEASGDRTYVSIQLYN